MKRIIVLLLAISLTLSLPACGGDEDTISNPNPVENLENAGVTVMSYESETLTSGMYAFIFSYLKTNKLHYLQQYGSSSIVEDTEVFWKTETENGTLGDIAEKDINDHCKMILICKKMSSEYGVSLSSENLEYVTDELNDWISAYGSVEGFSDYLRRYGITVDNFEDYLEKKYLITALQNKLCEKGGLCEVTEEMVAEEIAKSYGKVTHIFLRHDSYGGDATKKAEELLAALKSGAAMKDYAKLSEDTTYKAYPEGTLVKYDTANSAYAEAAASLKAGEYAMCVTNDGAYVITAFDIADDDVDELYESVYTSIADEKFLSVMEERYGYVELNTEELNKYDIITADIIDY